MTHASRLGQFKDAVEMSVGQPTSVEQFHYNLPARVRASFKFSREPWVIKWLQLPSPGLGKPLMVIGQGKAGMV